MSLIQRSPDWGLLLQLLAAVGAGLVAVPLLRLVFLAYSGAQP